MNITWTFGADRFMGNCATAAGFNATEGATVAVDGYLAIDFDLGPPDYGATVSVPIVDGFDDATVIVHVVARAGVSLDPAQLTVDYDGVEMETIRAFKLQDTEIDVVYLVARLYVGDLAGVGAPELTILIGGVSNPNVVSGYVEAVYVQGLEDAAPTAFEAGTVDVYESPLELADVDDFDFVFTAAVQAGFSVSSNSSITLTDDEGLLEQNDQITESTSVILASGFWFNECVTSFDCDCSVDANAKTLAQLRQRLLIRAGYASQAANPPTSVAATFNDYLLSAQEHLYSRFKALETKRMFCWNLQVGTRYYGLYDNANCCAAQLNRYQIEGAWVQDPNNTWWPLIYGIEPTMYTLDQNLGWPNYYEIRNCVEVFPEVMGEGYKLWIKGNTLLLPFTADADVTTIDPEAVFTYALGLAKLHKGDKDAGDPTPGRETGYFGMAIRRIQALVAGGHVNRRYIPGTSQLPIPTPPVMVQFDA